MRVDYLRVHEGGRKTSKIFRGLTICLFLILMVCSPAPRRVQGASLSWLALAPGIDYREFALATPNRLYVARLDRDVPQVTLESGIGQGQLVDGSETVSSMAARYEQAINYWDRNWGNRNRVIVAINGFFFDPETGVPYQGQVHSGWYAQRFDDRQNGSGIAWTLDRSLFIGDCVVHPPDKQYIALLRNGERLAFDGINRARQENELIIYSPQYGHSTLTGAEGSEVLVELNSPLLIVPEPSKVIGTVRDVRVGLGDTSIPFDHIVLSASGNAADRLAPMLQIGDEIGISQEMKQYEPDCRTPAQGGWENAYAAVGGSFIFLRGGVIQGFDDLGALLRNPRTVVAYNDRYVYFIVVDGRDRFQSQGMSIVELAVFAKTRLGAVWGVALDGGGSATMVVNGEVVNRPNVELSPQGGDGKPDERPILERVVGNSLMMVQIQPKEVSSAYHPGDRVAAVQAVDIRLGPGTNYAPLSVLSAGTEGVIVEHGAGLNGVLATGSYWWKVGFGGTVGWVAEEALSSLVPQ
jgi:hypothetical protein